MNPLHWHVSYCYKYSYQLVFVIIYIPKLFHFSIDKQGKLILFFLINKLVEKLKSCQFECFEVRKIACAEFISVYREQAFFVLDTNFQKRKFTRTDKSYKPILN
ncbi:MAG: hypothetical protein COB15_10910 [Flavobacteriales bacterium]|nr:MAG: hypothetical protein COB15_10910 [Flavobacteriales bacterium]